MGDSVFEVFRTYGGVPFGQREHLERLQRSADRLMISMPVSVETLSSEVAATLEAAGEGRVVRSGRDHARDRAAYIRPVDGHHTASRDHRRTGFCASRRSLRTRHRGCAASRITPDGRRARIRAPRHPTIWRICLRSTKPSRRGAQEALMLGRRGQILEGASSNLFIVKDGWCAPPEHQAGILMGNHPGCRARRRRYRGHRG